MNLLSTKRFIKKSKNVNIKKEKDKIIIENNNNFPATIILPKIFKTEKSYIKAQIYGGAQYGKQAVIKIVNRKAKVVSELEMNSTYYIKRPARIFMIAIRVMENSKIEINKLSMNFENDFENEQKENFKSDILLISPGYPSENNKYNCGFVHTRAQEYKKLNWKFDVACVNDIENARIYNFEGIDVCQTNYLYLRNLLQTKKYKKILIHFFNERYAQILDATDISDTKIYLYLHGADTMHRDFNITAARYFEPIMQTTPEQEAFFEYRDKILKRYSEKKNVKWIFVTEWTRKHSQELSNIEYKNSEVIPCLVDEKTFVFEKKNPELRKKIFVIRKFDNISTYAIDIDVRVILELSKRPFFNDLEFNIYGDGTEHERLLKPLEGFDNVHIHKKFLTHEEIAQMHKEHGIGLFATRYDSQAVSSCEAAMSGIVVISSINQGVMQGIDYECGTLCETENYIEYADKIEELYYNEQRFIELSQRMHDFVLQKYSYEPTIKKEIEMFEKEDKLEIEKPKYKEQDSNILLTIAVPSYNVEKFLANSVHSLINSELSNKIEVLIINDGSKDNTAQIGKKLEEITTVNGKSIVKLINKENGGHGSTINKGIELARGKYFKLMDGDDYFITEEFTKLIRILENENSDIILNNFIEDYAENSIINKVRSYDFMIPGVQYKLDDLCYEGYGFDKWGPLLSTSTYKTKMLKEANFKISEKCFYVDMELNMYTYINAETVTYYPLDLYMYYIGRQGQSISKESLIRNYKMHSKMTINLLDIYYKNDNISEGKKKYLEEKIIMKMINSHYDMVLDFFRKGKPFREFDKKLKEYPYFYNKAIKRRVKFHRITKGHLILIRFPIRIIKKILKIEH